MVGVLGLLAFWSAAAAPPDAAPAPDPLSGEIAAIRAFGRDEGEALWPGFGAAPFGFLLLRDGREILLCYPRTPPGFSAQGRDPATGCDRLTRPRGAFSDGMLAAMPIFGPPATIVMGTPETTGLGLVRWRVTILHEHFHQWQWALPEYYARVAALDLAGGDQSGMWMLNFAFPYADARAGAAYAETSHALAAALAARGSANFAARFALYLERRRAFAAIVGERNWRYFEFQLWQEGIARWTELALGRAAADPAMLADAGVREAEIVRALDHPDLAGQQRLVVYAMGAGEGLLLDACRAPWRSRYPNLLALGPLLDDAARSCRAPA